MEFRKKPHKKHSLDRIYDIVSVQIIGALIFVIVALAVKLIGGSLYRQSRKIYYDNINNPTDLSQIFVPADLPDQEYTIGENDYSEDTEKSKNDAESEMKENDESVLPTAAPVGGSNALIWPVTGKITSEFGEREAPVEGASTSHSGIDIGAEWDTPIHAAAAGTVTYAGSSEGYGNYIIVSHGSTLKTLYAHCSSLVAQKGDTVAQGDVIALVGNTGRANGSHLHFETIVGNKAQDPRWLLPEDLAV